MPREAKKETTSDPIRPEEPVTRSFTIVIYAGDGTGKGRGFFALLLTSRQGREGRTEAPTKSGPIERFRLEWLSDPIG